MSDAPGASTRIVVSRNIGAPVERVFALLADPDRHPDFDASGMVLRCHTHTLITELGDVFVMEMHNDRLGHYRTENEVVVYEPDSAIGWAPGLEGQPKVGHSYVFTLETTGADETVLTQTYEWSAVTDPDILSRMPRVSEAQLAESLNKINALVA